MIVNESHIFNNAASLARWVGMSGAAHESRIGYTREVLNAKVDFRWNELPYRPGMARKLGIVEALQFISGYFDERHIKVACPSLTYEYGIANAYGQKVSQQLPGVIAQLQENDESRRATLYIGKPEDGHERTKPCMQMVQFQIRNEALYTTVYARSWDAIHGLPYDVTMFNLVSQVMASLLNVATARTTVFAASLHVYVDVLLKMEKKWNEVNLSRPPYDRIEVFEDFQNLEEAREWAMDELNQIDSWNRGLPRGVESYAAD